MSLVAAFLVRYAHHKGNASGNLETGKILEGHQRREDEQRAEKHQLAEPIIAQTGMLHRCQGPRYVVPGVAGRTPAHPP